MPNSYMKKIITSTILFISAILSLNAQESETLFQYPHIPDILTNLDERSNYLVTHFWDRCNLKSAFYSKDRFKKAFNDYVAVAPYAHRDTMYLSIEKFITAVKKNPENMLILGEIAQESLYGDSAQFWSDELYLPFAKAVVETKKIPKEHKARFAYHVEVLEQSQVGMTAYPLTFTNEQGDKQNLKDLNATFILLFINETDCDDCIMARARMATNIKIQQLINEGKLLIVSINPTEADDEWKESASKYPSSWIKGASPEVDSHFDMRMTPSIYLLDQKHTILAKNIDINTLIATVSRL